MRYSGKTLWQKKGCCGFSAAGIIVGIAFAAAIAAVAVMALMGGKREQAADAPPLQVSVSGEENTGANEVIPQQFLPYPARLWLDPEEIAMEVGEPREVAIRLQTFDINTVAISVGIQWNPELVELDSVDTRYSVFPVRARQEEGVGVLYLVRAIPGDADMRDSDDGFTGEGEIARLTFVAKKKGSGAIQWIEEETKVHADDGRGSVLQMFSVPARISIE